MRQLNSVLISVSGFVRNTLWAVLLCVMPALHAQSEPYLSNSNWSEEMAQPIEISVRKAPLNIFMQALFANTGLDVEISESLTSSVSGRFEGSILSVIDKLTMEYGLVVRNDEGVFKVLSTEQAPKPKVNRSTRSITAAIPVTVSSPVTNYSSEDSTVAPVQKDLTTQPVQAVRVDKLVERVFVLKNATAIDTQRNDVNRTDIPGVVSQLKRLVEKLGISTFTYLNAPAANAGNSTHSIVALPSANAVVVKDLESRMALYIDLIESLDVAYETNSATASVTSTKVLSEVSPSTTPVVTSDDIAEATSMQPSSKWTVVR